MKLSQIIHDLPYGSNDVEITDVTNDSRKVTNGTLFFCIKGQETDGHKYAKMAADKGAAAVVAEHNVGVDCQVVVPDTHSLYAKACSAFYGHPQDSLKIIGVTGTNGKTTTTFLLKSLLEGLGHKVGLIGTIHNMVGDEIIETENTTPDAHELHRLFRMMADAGCEYVVMEVSSHALEQGRVAGIRFCSGVFTNLTQDHLDYHKTMENYVAAKRKLFDMTDKVVANADDAHFEKMIEGVTCPISSFGVNEGDWRAKDIKYYPGGTEFTIEGNGKTGTVKTKTPGRFSVYNALAAAVCALSVGFDFDDVCKGISAATAVKGRAEVVDTGRDFTVIIDYAHTPDGVENILSAMNEVKKGRLVALFGCGGDRDKTKRPKMGKIAAELADFCIVTSDNPRTEDPGAIIKDILEGMTDITTPYVVIENRAEAIKYAIDNAQKDDVIVLAGKGHETYQIIGKTKKHFDEREVVLDALGK